MKTEVVAVRDVLLAEKELAHAGELIQCGQLVAFPTETVYGLGANGLDAKASAKIYVAKGRPSDNPLILHVADYAMVEQIARDIPLIAQKFFTAFAPGPITLVLRKKSIVPERITGGLDTVGIRMPENKIARAFIRAAGVPIAAPSANLSGRPSPTTARSVLRDMNGRIPMILDGGACRFGVESTIVDCTEETPVVLRPGAITLEMLEEVAGRKCRLDPALSRADAVPKAPGMKYRHYAPRAEMILLRGEAKRMPEAFLRILKRKINEGRRPGILASSAVCQAAREILLAKYRQDYGAQGDLPVIASRIYEGLLALDQTDADILFAEGTVDSGLGLAIMNRLGKACGGHFLDI